MLPALEPGRNASRFEEAFAAYQGAARGILMVNGTVIREDEQVVAGALEQRPGKLLRS